MFEADHGPEVAIGDSKVSVRCGELDSVSRGELPLDLPEHIDALQPARVVGDGCSALQLDGESICASIDRLDGRETVPLDSLGLAAGVVLENVADIVSSRPASVCSGHVGTMRKCAELSRLSPARRPCVTRREPPR